MNEPKDAWDRLLDQQERELDAMNEEQLTLHLARIGRSPEDVRRSLARCMRLVDEHKKAHPPNPGAGAGREET